MPKLSAEERLAALDAVCSALAHPARRQILLTMKFRGGSFLRGRHSYKITDAGIVVYPRIEALYAHPSRQAAASVGRGPTGIAQLRYCAW